MIEPRRSEKWRHLFGNEKKSKVEGATVQAILADLEAEEAERRAKPTDPEGYIEGLHYDLHKQDIALARMRAALVSVTHWAIMFLHGTSIHELQELQCNDDIEDAIALAAFPAACGTCNGSGFVDTHGFDPGGGEHEGRFECEECKRAGRKHAFPADGVVEEVRECKEQAKELSRWKNWDKTQEALKTEARQTLAAMTVDRDKWQAFADKQATTLVEYMAEKEKVQDDLAAKEAECDKLSGDLEIQATLLEGEHQAYAEKERECEALRDNLFDCSQDLGSLSHVTADLRSQLAAMTETKEKTEQERDDLTNILSQWDEDAKIAAEVRNARLQFDADRFSESAGKLAESDHALSQMRERVQAAIEKHTKGLSDAKGPERNKPLVKVMDQQSDADRTLLADIQQALAASPSDPRDYAQELREEKAALALAEARIVELVEEVRWLLTHANVECIKYFGVENWYKRRDVFLSHLKGGK